jgi:hypothetical protein
VDSIEQLIRRVQTHLKKGGYGCLGRMNYREISMRKLKKKQQKNSTFLLGVLPFMRNKFKKPFRLFDNASSTQDNFL